MRRRRSRRKQRLESTKYKMEGDEFELVELFLELLDGVKRIMKRTFFKNLLLDAVSFRFMFSVFSFSECRVYLPNRRDERGR